MKTEKCQCVDEYNAPEGLICGDPDCWQTKKANENLRNIVEVIKEAYKTNNNV